jgi:hypothetical protein
MKSLIFFPYRFIIFHIFRHINIVAVKLNLPFISAICFYLILSTDNKINYSGLIKKRVIVLYRHDGLADLREAYHNKKSNIKYLILPRIILKDLFNHFLRNQVNDYCYKDIKDEEIRINKLRYYFYLKNLLLALKKMIKVDAILAFNIFYYAEREFQKAAKNLKIKYLVIMKEGISTKNRDKQLVWLLKNLSDVYYGDYVVTYNRNRMQVLIDSGAVKKNKVKAIGVSRYDKILKYSENLKNRNTLVYYSMIKDAGFFDTSGDPPNKYKSLYKKIPKHKFITRKKFNNVLSKNEKIMISILTEFAEKNKNFNIIVKYKTGGGNIYHKPKNKPSNLKFIHGGPGYQLLKDCKLAIGFNSSALIEAVLASCKVLVVSFNINHSKFKDSLLEYGGHAKYILDESSMKQQIQDIMLNSKLMKIKKPFKKQFINQVGFLDGKSGNRLIKFLNERI